MRICVDRLSCATIIRQSELVHSGSHPPRSENLNRGKSSRSVPSLVFPLSTSRIARRMFGLWITQSLDAKRVRCHLLTSHNHFWPLAQASFSPLSPANPTLMPAQVINIVLVFMVVLDDKTGLLGPLDNPSCGSGSKYLDVPPPVRW